ncbi:hypothetical protein [Streptomyces sp. NPDC048612]|uniref:hypothetical protein n=1 Tax=Streptomyces sp. NPDC048612 TaxID=3365579 RepID=UPI0037219949
MSTPAPRFRRPFVPAPGAAAPRQPVDQAKIGRRSVRRRAAGMTATEAAAALEDALLQQHMDRDREDLADDERCPAEVAEWERIAQLLATTDGVYDPESDAVVRDELAADRRAEEAEQQRLQEQQQLAARADELAALAQAGRLGRTVETRPGDEAARDVLVHRGEFHPVVDGWLAQALADRSGHYADPASSAAVDSLPAAVRAHAALLTALARTGAPAADSELEFAGRLAQADPDATNALASWLDTALDPTAPASAGADGTA